jgi:hypothetical protein
MGRVFAPNQCDTYFVPAQFNLGGAGGDALKLDFYSFYFQQAIVSD